MKVWKDERGGVLIYVLMISIVMVAMIPMVLSLTTNTALSDQVSRNEKLATHLATGGIESFIKYLDNYTSGDREDYLDSFTGFVTNKQFKTPEGVDINYTLSRSALEDNLYDITASATVGTGRTKRTKEIVYRINASMGAPVLTKPLVDPDDRTDQILKDGIYLDDTGHDSGVPVTVKKETGLQAAISKAISDVHYSVSDVLSDYDSLTASCGCSTIDQVNSFINYNSSSLQVLRVSNAVHVDGTMNFTWGSSTKPVIVIFEKPVYFKNGGSMTVYGDLIFMERFESDGGFGTNVNSVNGSYGNVYAMNNFYVKNGGNFNASGMFYADSINNQNNGIFSTSKMVVKNTMYTKNNLTVNISSGGTDLLLGSLSMGQNSTLSVPSGDILVENNIQASQNELNNTVISAGGNIGVGGSITLKNNNTVKTGGGTTSLKLPAPPPDPDNPEDPTEDPGWSPARQ